MDPLTAQLLIGIGTPLVGRLFAGRRPKPPDMYTPALAQLSRRRGVMNTRMDQANAQMQGDLAAAGATGSAGASARDKLFRAGNDAQLDFDALAMDTITRANNSQQYFDYQDKMGTYDARLEGTADLGESFSDYFGSRAEYSNAQAKRLLQLENDGQNLSAARMILGPSFGKQSPAQPGGPGGIITSFEAKRRAAIQPRQTYSTLASPRY
jgi:hypothetical protein